MPDKKYRSNSLSKHNGIQRKLELFFQNRLKESELIQCQIGKLFTAVIDENDLGQQVLDQGIGVLNLSRRVYLGLIFNSINTLDSLTSYSPKKLKRLPMLGATAVTEIQSALNELGLSLASERFTQDSAKS